MQPPSNDDLFFSEAPPEDGPNIDDDFVELVWHWVSKNPEVTVEGEAQPVDDVADPDATIEGGQPKNNATNKLDKYRKQRLCTGEDRVWYAIAGHGVDYKRIPPLEFQALSVIAAQGSRGVLQPDVTKLTGQDKRSLPKRTDNLAKNGYVYKTTVIARGTKTSLLKLKKFAGESDLPEDETAPPGTAIIQYNLWFDEVMRLLKENDNIMAFEDVRIGLGINKKRFETRALHRCVRRLANVGCLRKVTAKVEAPASQPDADMKSVRSLLLLREPTEIDRIAFMRSDWQRSKLLDSTQIAQFTSQAVNDDEDEDEDDVEAIEGVDGEPEDPKRVLNRSPPLWDPELPFPNYLYKRIEEAGIAGTVSGELYDDSVGHFWKRAMDEMLVRLTDLWQFSQPPHLRHLSIIKDTGQRGKQPTFQYRTYDNFVKAVEIGDAFWEGVFGPEIQGKGKAGKKKAEAAASAQPDLDGWGFPKLSPKLFVGHNGAATLEQCRQSAKPAMNKALNPSSSKLTPAEQKKLNKKMDEYLLPLYVIARRMVHPDEMAPEKRTASQAGLDDELDEETTAQSPPPQEPAPSPQQDRSARKYFWGNDNTEVTSSVASITRIVEPSQTPSRRKGRPPKTTPVSAATTARRKKKAAIEGRTPAQPEERIQPGVSINPPGSIELKQVTLQPIGRPKKAKIAVFRSSRLKNFPWFVAEPPRTGGKPKRVPRASLASRRSSGLQETPSRPQQDEEVDPSSVAQDPTDPEQTPNEGGHASMEIDTRGDTEQEKLGAPSEEPEAVDEPSATDREQEQQTGPAESAPADEPQAANSRDASVEQDVPMTGVDGAYDEPPAPAADDGDSQAVPNEASQSLDPELGDKNGEKKSDDSLPDITVQDVQEDENTPRQYKKAGVTKNIGALHIKRRRVVMDVIRACGGIFPGKGEILFPFATRWQREHKQTPDRHTVDNVIKGLIASGTLKKLTFFFKSKKGLTVERSILAEPEIDPNSLKVKLLQKRIIDNFPATVLPEEADVSPEYRKQALRNPQITHLAKWAKAAGETPVSTPGDDGPAPHYIRDEFPADQTLTVRRTANPDAYPFGLGAIDAQLASIKRKRKIANLKRRRPQRIHAVDADSEDDVAELTYEEAMLRGEQQSFDYGQGRAKERSGPLSRAERMRNLGFGGRKLPGRILGSKGQRKPPTFSSPSTVLRSLPWNAIGYVASQAGHSTVEPNWIATTSRSVTVPKRIERIQWQWVDPTVADFRTEREASVSSGEGVTLYDSQSGSFGVLIPDAAQMVDSQRLHQNVDVQLAPRNLDEILSSHLLQPTPESNSELNEATKFFDEVERVEAWEHQLLKARRALARGAERPFINYSTPSVVSLPIIADVSKRGRNDEDEDSPKAKRRRQTQTKASLRSKIRPESDLPRFKKRDRRAAANFSDKDHDRLAKAIALVAVVSGGLAYRRNWYIISHALSYQFESEFLRHRWDKVRDQKDPLVKQLQAQIWEPFLDAYERDVLPRINFFHLESTDWPALMEWVETEVLTSTPSLDYTKPAAIINKLPNLPATTEELKSGFVITENAADANLSREEFFTAAVDKRRKDVALSCLNGTPLITNATTPGANQDSNDLLRSWARAVVLTDDASYNSGDAYEKIMKFGNEMLDSTIRDLCTEKILQVKKKGRRLPGRNLKLDEAAFLPVFKRWSDKQGPEHLFLTRVAKKRAEILDVVRQQGHFDLQYSADDELYVVLTNMVGQGLLAVKSQLPERNDDFDAPFPKLTAWGYSGFNYNVRTFDKNRLRFSIVYEKTDKFTFEHGLKNDVPIPLHPPQRPDEDGLRIPVWVDIHGKLLPRMWEMVFRSVLNLVVFRTGINAEGIEEAHKGKIWTWEIELLMKWMEETGVVERSGPGVEVDGLWKGGWKAGEWWYCALCPDVAKWPALSE